MPSILGLHHVTAIASDAQRTLDFYAGVLGLRFVKRTVNFDDPSTYHFYFGDETGSPGSLITFFAWPGAHRGRVGAGQVAVISFAIAPSAVGFWLARLLRHGIPYEGPSRRTSAGGSMAQVLTFRDPDGLMLELVAHPSAEARPVWRAAPGIAPAEAIHGLHGVMLWVEQGDATARVLTEILGFHEIDGIESTRRFAAGDGGPGTLVDVRAIGGFVAGASGPGTVHHVAWRVLDDAAELALRERLVQQGLKATPVIDRHYFRSVYFPEPGGVLYELATLAPGFTIDEPADALGERLTLPPQYEPQRATIEAVLPVVHPPGRPPFYEP